MLNWVENPQMSLDDEISRISALTAQLRSIPESEVFGTPACRAVVVGQTGEFNDGRLRGRHSMVFEIAHKLSAMMGKPKWDELKAIDVNPNNRVELMKKVSDPWVYNRSNDTLWKQGVVFARSADIRNNTEYPATCTIYVDDTSVLRDIPTVMAAIAIEKIHHRAWAKFSPTSGLSDIRLLELCDRFVSEEAMKVFGERYVVRPNAKLTSFDQQNGRSWTLATDLYANKSKDIAYTKVTVVRNEE